MITEVILVKLSVSQIMKQNEPENNNKIPLPPSQKSRIWEMELTDGECNRDARDIREIGGCNRKNVFCACLKL